MWCCSAFPARQRRTVVLEVARPPPRIATVWPSPSGWRWSSTTRMGQPPAGAGPATAMSPPRPTSAPPPTAPAMVGRGAVGGERLGRGAQVERDPARDPHAARARVQQHRAPAGHGLHPHQPGGAAALHQPEVAVVADVVHRAADGRVHVSAAHLGGAQRHGERLRQELADLDHLARGRVDAAELGVVAEAAAGQVDVLERGPQERLRLIDGARPVHDHERGGAQRGEGRRRQLAAHDAPDGATGAWPDPEGATWAPRPVVVAEELVEHVVHDVAHRGAVVAALVAGLVAGRRRGVVGGGRILRAGGGEAGEDRRPEHGRRGHADRHPAHGARLGVARLARAAAGARRHRRKPASRAAGARDCGSRRAGR